MSTLEIWFSQSSRIGDFCLLRMKPSVCDFPKLFFAKYAFLVVCGPWSFCPIISVVKQGPRTISLNVHLQQGKKEGPVFKFSDRWHQDKPLLLRAKTNASICASSSRITRPAQMHKSKYFEDKITSAHTGTSQLLQATTQAAVPIAKVVPPKWGVVAGSCMPLTQVQKPFHEALLWLL